MTLTLVQACVHVSLGNQPMLSQSTSIWLPVTAEGLRPRDLQLCGSRWRVLNPRHAAYAAYSEGT